MLTFYRDDCNLEKFFTTSMRYDSSFEEWALIRTYTTSPNGSMSLNFVLENQSN